MTKSAVDLADAIIRFADERGRELPLPDDAVRGEEYTVPIGTWRERWRPEVPLPALVAGYDLPDAGDADDDAEPQPLTTRRQDVLARAADVTTEADAADLYVHMCAWAGGYQDVSRSRLLRPLQDDGTAASLLRSHQLVRRGRAVDAYDSLWRGRNRIKRVGPSLFTGWLYFSAYDNWDTNAGPAPLVLDHRTARVLGWNGARVSAQAYGRYLELAAQTAAELGERTGAEVTPHAVEHALMTLGREPA